MAKTLMGAVISAAAIEATFRYDAFGATKTDKKTGPWPSAVTEAAAALLAAANAGASAAGLPAVVQAQIYTSITDPQGHPGFSLPGELVDLTFRPGATPQGTRIGDDETVPDDIAAARDALKTAIVAAL